MINTNFSFRFVAAVLVILSLSPKAFAWGRRGHQIVGETAAIVVSSEPQGEFMLGHSFDFGYYANVPDFVWKRPATYAFEKPQHFMDLEIFDREFAKHPEITQPLELTRKDFETKFPEIKPEAGRSFWRIRELYSRLEEITHQIKELKEENRVGLQKLQIKWLVTAGVMAHYIGDLSMPLHVSENYDGQLTGQKGLHGYYEEVIVDALYPQLNCEVNAEAKKLWPSFTKKNKNKSVLELVLALTEETRKAIPSMLAIDKKSKREDVAKNAKAYASLIRKGLVASSLTLAELYRRQLGWKFDDKQFYSFEGEPEYIFPEGSAMPQENLDKHR